MDSALLALSLLIGIVLSALFAEWFIHQRSLYRIPIRIHVNGTRGKSSVTRLVAAGLRAGGFSVLGKTTGSDPRIIDLQGKDRRIHRLTGASIGELVRFMRYFAQFRPQAVVMECMAVQPQYQWVAEQHMVKSTHSVITNARLDHVDEMGYKLEDIAQSLSNTIPFNGKLFTAEQTMLSTMKDIANKRKTIVITATHKDVSLEEMDGFNHIEHAENVALSLNICIDLGIDRKIALDGMKTSTPDPGALRRWDLKYGDYSAQFINAFAANDPTSTIMIWHMIQKNIMIDSSKIGVFLNTRPDRESRTRQMLDIIKNDIKPRFLFVRGEHLERFKKEYFEPFQNRYKTWSKEVPGSVVIDDMLTIENEILIYGIGNIVGSGFALLDELKMYRIVG
jgi:gamma-polyglutamate synthase